MTKEEPAPRTVTPAHIRSALAKVESVIPEELIRHHLKRAGFHSSDPQVVHAISFAAHQFIATIALDSGDLRKLRHMNKKRKVDREKSTLTLEDLAAGLAESGIEVTKPSYFSDKV